MSNPYDSRDFFAEESILNLLYVVLAYEQWALRTVLYDTNGNPLVFPSIATTAAFTQVGDSASSVQLLAADSTRKGFKIYNTSSAILYVVYGATATTAAFTARLTPQAILEESGYNGEVAGIWASDAGGNANITSMS